MKTQIVYVLVSSEQDYYLEELWVSLYSLRRYHLDDKVVVLTDAPTAQRIEERTAMRNLITELKIIPVLEDYSGKLRSREIKTSMRFFVDGDFLFIDTDTVVCQPLDEIDSLNVDNLAMVPELHDKFKHHVVYNYTCSDTKRIFDVDVSDSPYWFNSGCMLVRDNAFTHNFFKKWNENWKHSAFKKNNSSDQRALLATDKSFGYAIECLPDVYNCQVAMSIQYFYDAKIIHFWHMRSSFTPNLDYSPYCNKEIYKQIRADNGISEATKSLIYNVKQSFRTPSMLVGRDEISFLFSPFYVVLGRAYRESKSMRWFLDKLIKYTNLYYRAKRKLWQITCNTHR